MCKSENKKNHSSARAMARTVLLLRLDWYHPISAEIRTVDSQSDLRICYSYEYIEYYKTKSI